MGERVKAMFITITLAMAINYPTRTNVEYIVIPIMSYVDFPYS